MSDVTRGKKLVSIGNYRLASKKLGNGTFARVELATHLLLHRSVALKVIVKSEIQDPYMRKHLYREAAILGRLSHPNIVNLIEICKSADVFCLVLEFIPGGTLFEHVQSKGVLEEQEARFLSKQLISAISYLHKERILHRDLKLENILLDDGMRLVLIDFGLSNSWYPGKVMHTHCGSAEYASPELFRKDVPYSSGVDVWSFGVILYTMTNGHLPFQCEADESSNGDTLPILIKRIMKGLDATHFKELNKASLDCRSLIIRCLDVNQKSRISVKDIAANRWISEAPGHSGIESKHDVTDMGVAMAIKEQLKLKLSAEKILDHIKLKRFGTTAGCFNLMKVEERKKLREGVAGQTDAAADVRSTVSPVQPGSREKGEDDLGLRTLQRDKVHLRKADTCDVPEKEAKVEDTSSTAERRSRSQDSRAPLSWRRSFLNSASGKISFSRLKRVDRSEERPTKGSTESGSGLFRALGQRALEDISNSVRPLLRRSSSKEVKTAKLLQLRSDEEAQPPHQLPPMLIDRDEPVAGAKFKMKFAKKEEMKRIPRRPIR